MTRMILAASLGVCVSSLAAHAQHLDLIATAEASHPPATSSSPITVGVFGGGALPSGEYEDDFAAVGYDFGVRLNVRPARGAIGLHVDGEYLKNGAKAGVCADADCSGRILVGFVNVDLGLPIPLPIVRPYATAGVGYAAVKLQATETSTPTSASDRALAWNVGGGVRLSLGSSFGDWGAFVEARYIQTADVDVALGPYRNESGTVSVKPVTVGLTFRPCWSCAELE